MKILKCIIKTCLKSVYKNRSVKFYSASGTDTGFVWFVIFFFQQLLFVNAFFLNHNYLYDLLVRLAESHIGTKRGTPKIRGLVAGIQCMRSIRTIVTSW